MIKDTYEKSAANISLSGETIKTPPDHKSGPISQIEGILIYSWQGLWDENI